MTVFRVSSVVAAAVLLAIAGLAFAQAAKAPSNAPAEMTTYQLVFLTRGDPSVPADPAERAALQEKHIGHLKAMHEAGKLVIAGPLLDDNAIRGICVYKVATPEEARSLAEGDPAVKIGRLKVEVHPWMVQKGILP
jgi:uncharacterized protein YciI